MSNPVPSSLAMTTIGPGVNASPLNSNYSATQVAVNALITAMGGGAAGQKLEAADSTHVQWVYPPGYQLAYVEFTASVTANNVAEAAATQIVSAGAVTFDGTAVDIEVFCPSVAAGGALTGGINLWDVSTDLGRLFDGTVATVPAGSFPMGSLKRRITPSVGSHTYNARIWTTTASNFVAAAGAGGVGVKLPGYIKITKA